MMDKSLIRKYNVPGPRYTSYPTVPYWEDNPKDAVWATHVAQTFTETNSEEGISLYIHLPYCESLCTYCGCNTRITVNHQVEGPYIDAVLKEWELYHAHFSEKPRIRELHLGGGTPTFFSPENLTRMIQGILSTAEKAEDAEFSFEAHPKNTTPEHLQALYEVGFRRLSLGIQDFDPEVQKIVNRIQPFEMVEEVVENARRIGYESINFDLIYGLPKQRYESVKDTIEKVNRLRPERIAFYSYAHVPWVKPGQRMFTEKDLPSGAEKRALYELGKEEFEKQGYVEIGMDHFALPEDELAQAMQQETLHRNFMGYTSRHTQLMVGLGVSSISDSWSCFAQNRKKVEDYLEEVQAGRIPIYRGHVLTEEDLIVRRHILEVMCHFATEWKPGSILDELILRHEVQLAEMTADGLLELHPNRLTVTEIGKPFVRNICMLFDARLARKQSGLAVFSQTV